MKSELTVYSKRHCPACEKVKALLIREGWTFKVIGIDENDEARMFLIKAGHRMVPQIYMGEFLFVEGGYDGLVAHIGKGSYEQA